MKRRIGKKCSNRSNRWLNTAALTARQLYAWRVKCLVELLLPFCVFLAISGCSNETNLSFLNPQGPIAAAQRWHFYWVLGIMAVLVAGPIFLLTPFLAWRYRYGAKESRRYTPHWKYWRPLEFMTWGGPIVIVVVLAFFVWRDSHKLDPYKPLASHQPALRMQVIGYDWKWLFIYPDQGIASVGVMPIPVGEPVAMQLTSATVMQSLQIPALVGQIYAMGGMITQLHFKASRPGRSLGENTMYNGSGFHQQKFTAIAIPPDAFKAWVHKVQQIGVPLDAHTYKALSQPGTVAELAAALPQASYYGNVYLRGVTSALFPAVVKATMNGTPVALGHASIASAGSPVAVARKAVASSVEKTP